MQQFSCNQRIPGHVAMHATGSSPGRVHSCSSLSRSLPLDDMAGGASWRRWQSNQIPLQVAASTAGRIMEGGLLSEADLDLRGSDSTGDDVRLVQLAAQELNPESFAPYGQVVGPTEDGTKFGPQDAALEISQGVPRVYVMRLHDKPPHFDCITHHAAVTQCLGAIGSSTDPWYIAVAPPSLKGSSPPSEEDAELAKAGHWFVPPKVEEVVAFRVAGPQVIKFHVGTWHAGPFFRVPLMDFCNLELADTNVVDHTSHFFRSKDKVVFEILDDLEGQRDISL